MQEGPWYTLVHERLSDSFQTGSFLRMWVSFPHFRIALAAELGSNRISTERAAVDPPDLHHQRWSDTEHSHGKGEIRGSKGATNAKLKPRVSEKHAKHDKTTGIRYLLTCY